MNGLARAFRTGVSELFPGYFAMVMATGVVAIQANKLGYAMAARLLVLIAVVAYLTLWGLTLLRALLSGTRLVSDFRSFVKGPAFFTISAGTTVLGKSLLLVMGGVQLALCLWTFAWFIWAFLIYGFCFNLFTSQEKPAFAKSINGVWLIIPVATQSLSILTSLLSGQVQNHSMMLLVSTSMFMLGSALYLVVITAIMYRLVFCELDPQDLRPAYWVCMGASAISTLAGVEICRRLGAASLPVQALPTVQLFTVFFWIVASAWIPLLVGLGIWRHALRHVPVAYEPQYWSMVFPLAMYAICTGGMADVFGFDSLRLVSKAFLLIAGAAWAVVFVGLLKNLSVGLFAALRPVALAPVEQEG